MQRGSLHTGEIRDGRIVTTKSFAVGPRVGAAAPLADAGTGWIVASGTKLIHVAEDGQRSIAAAVAPRIEGVTLNDGVCAPDGSFWVGSQAVPRRPAGALYRVQGRGKVDRALTEVTVSNGIGFDRDGARMFYIDTLPHRRLEVFDVDDEGALANRRTIAVLDHGNPDGLAVDDEGGVWVAMWGAGEVCRVAPGGDIDVRVEVGTSRPSAVTLRDGLLVITTAAVSGEPDSGRIYLAEVGATAPPTPPFRGGFPSADGLSELSQQGAPS